MLPVKLLEDLTGTPLRLPADAGHRQSDVACPAVHASLHRPYAAGDPTAARSSPGSPVPAACPPRTSARAPSARCPGSSGAPAARRWPSSPTPRWRAPRSWPPPRPRSPPTASPPPCSPGCTPTRRPTTWRPARRTVAALAAGGTAVTVVAVGGGSAIDAAKGIALAAVNPERGRDLDYRGTFARPALPLVAVPTTAGTGAETNAFGVVTDVAGRPQVLRRPRQHAAGRRDPGPGPDPGPAARRHRRDRDGRADARA